MKKIAVITGASKGIGKACCLKFLENGYTVVNASRTNTSPPSNENYHFIQTDVANEQDIKLLVSSVVSNFGKIDVLINNAGFGVFNELVASTTEEFDSMFNVNVRGLYLCTRYVLPHMINANQGTIINISSIAGKNAIEKASLYCATKHAVMAISKSLMLEVRKHNIRVSAICPGSVDTHFFDQPGTILNSSRETILSPFDVADAALMIVNMPDRALVNEVELRPANPQKNKNK